MRRNLLLIVAILFTVNAWCQNFVGLTRNSEGQTIILNNDQVLEIKLPCQPSTGYGWYPTTLNKDVIAQAGDWEFVSSQASKMVGQQGTGIFRFIGLSKGTSELTFEYKRPWEKNKSSNDVFKVTIVSSGKYTGNYIPYKTQKSLTQQINSSSSSNSVSLKSSFPSSFNWLSQCSPVKDQGNCGSCWSFAATGCFETIINIIDHNMRNLSEQWLLNCDSKYNGCLGGFSPNDYWVSPGAVYTSDLPYNSSSCAAGSTCEGTCSTYPYHEKADSSKFINVINDHSTYMEIEQIKHAIYNYGPVWVDACSGYYLPAYVKGIDTTNDGNLLNHAVVLVGWKDSVVSKTIAGYWILRNSWGTSYGEKGYVRIGYGVSSVGSDANYIVYKGGVACSGTPNPGNTLTTANPVCASEAFTLSVQSDKQGSTALYQWQSSPDNSTWTNINGATKATYVTTQSTATYYKCKVTCSGNTGTSAPLEITMIAPAKCYCTGTYSSTNSPGIDITNVTFGSINNSQPSYCKLPDSYLSFTGLSTTVDPGSTNPISITADFNPVYWGVWIDWNNSGSFTDNVNKYTLIHNVYGQTLTGTGSIIVPAGATSGSHRMRIRANYNTDPGQANACSNLQWGEQQDYTVIVGKGSGINSISLNTSVNLYPNPNDGNFTLEINGYTGASYTLRISNLLGEVMYTEKIMTSGSKHTQNINLVKLNNGIYQLELYNAIDNIKKSIVIQK